MENTSYMNDVDGIYHRWLPGLYPSTMCFEMIGLLPKVSSSKPTTKTSWKKKQKRPEKSQHTLPQLSDVFVGPLKRFKLEELDHGKLFRDVSELPIQDGYSTASAIALMLFFARMTDLRSSANVFYHIFNGLVFFLTGFVVVSFPRFSIPSILEVFLHPKMCRPPLPPHNHVTLYLRPRSFETP